MPIELLPVIVFFVGAILAALAGGRGPAIVALLTPLVAAVAAWRLWPAEALVSAAVMDYVLYPVRIDAFALIFAGLFMLAALLAAIYALGVRDRLQHAALLGYAGAGIGAVLAGDWITLFIFWELIALSGVLLVWSGRTPAATRAGIRYLVFQVTSGVTVLAGMLWYASASGDWQVGHIGLDAPGAWLILIACGVKTGFPLLHGWIPDAYPRASAMGSAILIAVTTKVGVYALARLFAGEEILVWIGLVMALWPLFYALIEGDLRRVLAYTLMVQIGLMVAAVGVGSGLALDGVAMHVVMDVLFKMLLFMALGVVLLRTGTTRASELGGLARQMPLTTLFVAVGIAANCALPLTGAFESKKLLLGGLEYAGHTAVWLVLMSLSGLGMLYLGLRVLWEGFLRPVEQPRPVGDAPLSMTLAMSLIVGLLLVTGLFPVLTDALRPFGSTYSPFNAVKIAGQIQLLLFALAAYLLLARFGLRLPAVRAAVWLDTEWIYRKLIPGLAAAARDGLAALRDAAMAAAGRVRLHPGDGRMRLSIGKSWPTGSMALWVAILLAVLLIFGLR